LCNQRANHVSPIKSEHGICGLDAFCKEVLPMPYANNPPRGTCQPTQHALLIVGGHFAQTLQLRALLEQVPIPQKTVQHSPAAPYGRLTQAQRHLRGCQRRWRRLVAQQGQVRQQARQALRMLTSVHAPLVALCARRTALAAENAQHGAAPCCRMRMDAGFCSGENLTLLLELGYEIETKMGHGAVVGALRQRVGPETRWIRVGKNAEMIGWTDYQLYSCPYPVTVALERFYTEQGVKYGVSLRSQEVGPTELPDLRQWFAAYNGRQTIEAGIKQSKTVFKLQHLMTRQPVGMQIQVGLPLFAANFVRWTEEWLHDRLTGRSSGTEQRLARTKYLVRIAANSPGTVETQGEQILVRFSPLSGLEGVVVHLRGPGAVQLALPLFHHAHF
jgi:hypothetical protein